MLHKTFSSKAAKTASLPTEGVPNSTFLPKNTAYKVKNFFTHIFSKQIRNTLVATSRNLNRGNESIYSFTPKGESFSSTVGNKDENMQGSQQSKANTSSFLRITKKLTIFKDITNTQEKEPSSFDVELLSGNLIAPLFFEVDKLRDLVKNLCSSYKIFNSTSSLKGRLEEASREIMKIERATTCQEVDDIEARLEDRYAAFASIFKKMISQVDPVLKLTVNAFDKLKEYKYAHQIWEIEIKKTDKDNAAQSTLNKWKTSKRVAGDILFLRSSDKWTVYLMQATKETYTTSVEKPTKNNLDFTRKLYQELESLKDLRFLSHSDTIKLRNLLEQNGKQRKKNQLLPGHVYRAIDPVFDKYSQELDEAREKLNYPNLYNLNLLFITNAPSKKKLASIVNVDNKMPGMDLSSAQLEEFKDSIVLFIHGYKKMFDAIKRKKEFLKSPQALNLTSKTSLVPAVPVMHAASQKPKPIIRMSILAISRSAKLLPRELPFFFPNMGAIKRTMNASACYDHSKKPKRDVTRKLLR